MIRSAVVAIEAPDVPRCAVASPIRAGRHASSIPGDQVAEVVATAAPGPWWLVAASISSGAVLGHVDHLQGRCGAAVGELWASRGAVAEAMALDPELVAELATPGPSARSPLMAGRSPELRWHCRDIRE